MCVFSNFLWSLVGAALLSLLLLVCTPPVFQAGFRGFRLEDIFGGFDFSGQSLDGRCGRGAV